MDIDLVLQDIREFKMKMADSDVVEEIDITIEDDDVIETISGVGGSEFVYKKDVDSIALGDLKLHNFKIEVGVMDYGFGII